MNLPEIKKEVEVELNLGLEELKEKSIEELKVIFKKLKRNLRLSEVLMIKKKDSQSIPYHIEMHKLNVDTQIDNIEEILETRKDTGKETAPKRTNTKFTLNQKFQILKKLGWIEKMVDEITDEKVQQQIFSALFDCHEDTSRKILTGSYRKTREVRHMDYKELLKKLKK